jgi:hypothetical protein
MHPSGVMTVLPPVLQESNDQVLDRLHRSGYTEISVSVSKKSK